MTLEDEIFAALSGDAAVTAIAGDRIYPIVSPNNETRAPEVIFSRVASSPVSSTEGYSGLNQVRISIDCKAKRLAQVKDLAKAARDVILEGMAPLIPTWLGDFDLHDEDLKTYRVVCDFSVWVNE